MGTLHRLRYLGHSAVALELKDGRVLLIDPFFTGNPRAAVSAEQWPRADLILVTHAHGDHLGDTVALARRLDSCVVSTYDLCSWCEAQGVKRTSGMNLGGRQWLDGIEIQMVRADHTSGLIDEGGLRYGGVAAGFVLGLPDGPRVYHAGDTALFTDMQLIAEFGRPQVGLLPIGDHFTMGPREAARAVRWLGLEVVIPIHWGTFPILTGTPEAFAESVAREGTPAQVVVLQPGESYELQA
jgi:L-ascorbate metabolism protein UlaG (beta-lactamase superfamily)